jgi:hypothetical protein
MEMVLSLNENDAQEFKDWYINYPLAEGIVELWILTVSVIKMHDL